MSILNSRNQLLEEREVDIRICAICGKEVTISEVGVSADVTIHDWVGQGWLNHIRLNFCKEHGAILIKNLKNFETRSEKHCIFCGDNLSKLNHGATIIGDLDYWDENEFLEHARFELCKKEFDRLLHNLERQDTLDIGVEGFE